MSFSRAAGEPLSPMSSCKSKGLHYTVKDERSGFACLLCGLAGDLDMIKSKRCQTCEAPATKLDFQETNEAPVSTREAQEALDREMAWQLQHLKNLETLEAQEAELKILHKQESEIEQLLTLQQLESEEMVLQALLNEQRALALAEKASRVLEARSPEHHNPAAAPVQPEAMEVEGPKDEFFQAGMIHPVELYGYGYLTAGVVYTCCITYVLLAAVHSQELQSPLSQPAQVTMTWTPAPCRATSWTIRKWRPRSR